MEVGHRSTTLQPEGRSGCLGMPDQPRSACGAGSLDIVEVSVDELEDDDGIVDEVSLGEVIGRLFGSIDWVDGVEVVSVVVVCA